MTVLSPEALFPVVRGLLADQLSSSRARSCLLDSIHWSAEDRLDESLGVDSLELLEAARYVDQMFQLSQLGIEEFLLVRRTLGQWAALAADALAHAEAGLVFSSSASMGAAHHHRHELSQLAAEACFWHSQLGNRKRILSLVPAQHIYGFLFTVLLPQLSGSARIEMLARLPHRVISEVAPGDVLVAHPLVWQSLADAGHNLPDDVVGISSTAPLSATTWQQCLDLGLSRMIEVYGSSETAGIGWRESPKQAFALLDRWQDLDSKQIDALVEQSGGRHYPLPDRLTVVGARQFYPAGRRDQAVQVAGRNVYPLAVAECIRAVDEVEDCQVRLDQDAGRLKALVITASGDIEALEASLRQRVAAAFSDAARPGRYDFARRMPRNAMGKPQDW